MYKPKDFLIGLVDFLAILLPGIVLAFWSLPIFDSIRDQVLAVPTSKDAQALLFLTLALFLGHVAYGIGSALEELWGRIRHFWRQRTARTTQVKEPVLGSSRQTIDQRARDAEAAAAILRRLGHPSWDGFPSKTYCTVLVMAENERVAGDIERLYAFSRFFRTFSAVFLIMLIAGGSPSLRFLLAWTTRLEGLVVVFTLFVASFFGYRIYRRMHERRLYRAVVVLLTPKAARLDSNTAEGAESTKAQALVHAANFSSSGRE